jgi:hypothetical protein
MNQAKLNILRWILLFISTVLFILDLLAIDTRSLESIFGFISFLTLSLLWFVSIIALLVFFIYKIRTITRGIKYSLLALALFSFILYLIFSYVLKASVPNLYFTVTFGYILIYSIVLCSICYLEKIEILLPGLIIAVLIGFVINRLGVKEGPFIIPFAFLLSSMGFIYMVFKAIFVYKMNKSIGLLFIIFYSVISILNALFLIKFIDVNPALNNVYDTIGVIIFLLACLTLFVILPFSNYIDWSISQKRSFRRLIIAPLILFLIIFSLKFLLQDTTYRKIFFNEYSKKEKIHFGMKDYVIDFSRK